MGDMPVGASDEFSTHIYLVMAGEAPYTCPTGNTTSNGGQSTIDDEPHRSLESIDLSPISETNLGRATSPSEAENVRVLCTRGNTVFTLTRVTPFPLLAIKRRQLLRGIYFLSWG